MRPVILYRGKEFEEQEFNAAFDAGFYCTDSRMMIPKNSLVIARYSCLPFYQEQERDLEWSGSRLINNYAQHRYIADIGNWYPDLKDLTPETWERTFEIPESEEGPFILKGETNSKKHLFATHMFAKTRGDIGRVLGNLLDDSLIAQQKIYIRKFVPLVTYMKGINLLPVTKEYRFFVAYGQVVSGGFYWSSHVEDLKDLEVAIEPPECVPREFLDKVIQRIGHNANAITIDVAQLENGQWIVVELNDLQMSGLSENDPKKFYSELYRIVSSQKSP